MNAVTAEIITEDELCSFLLSHVYTKYSMNNKDREIFDNEYCEIQKKLKTCLFDTKNLYS